MFLSVVQQLRVPTNSQPRQVICRARYCKFLSREVVMGDR